MKKYKVVLTDTAKKDLQEIAFYIASASGSREIAKRFVNELREKAARLETFPNTGTIPNNRILKSLGYRFLMHKDYLLFYQIEESQKKVFVMACFNGKQDYLRVMRKYL